MTDHEDLRQLRDLGKRLGDLTPEEAQRIREQVERDQRDAGDRRPQ